MDFDDPHNNDGIEWSDIPEWWFVISLAILCVMYMTFHYQSLLGK